MFEASLPRGGDRRGRGWCAHLSRHTTETIFSRTPLRTFEGGEGSVAGELPAKAEAASRGDRVAWELLLTTKSPQAPAIGAQLQPCLVCSLRSADVNHHSQHMIEQYQILVLVIASGVSSQPWAS